MSADNGVYILETPSHDDPSVIEYRVAHEMAIENVTSDDPSWDQNEMARSYFRDCVVFHDSDAAMKLAVEIYDEIMDDDWGMVEYGISFIQLTPNRPFPCD